MNPHDYPAILGVGPNLRVGERLPCDVYDEEGRLLLRRGQRISSERQLRRLLHGGRVQQGARSQARVPATQGRFAHPGGPAVRRGYPVPEGFSPCERLHACAQALQRTHDRIRAGERDFLPRLRQVAERLRRFIDLDADAALGMAHLSRAYPEQVLHPLRQAIVADVVARASGFSEACRNSLIGAALSADIGMLELRAALDRQATGLSQAQRRALTEHPERSAQLLREAGLDDPDWLRAVMEHHERLDGSGYPHGVRAEAICEVSGLVMLADVYVAMVTPRAHRPARTSKEVLRKLFTEADQRYPARYAQQIVRELGIYPPGTVVGLETGEVALVTRRAGKRTQPWVYLLQRADGRRQLRAVERNLTEEGVEIRRSYRPEDIKVPIPENTAWGYSDMPPSS
ncbi:MAG: HD domain-containing protein [Halorhodospira halophila]|uniref:HD-GYP domain-containing protein n=1 Tax=Halorhodospira halophila TaxID=1053 RepID=UPI0026EE7E43|nr:HD domain-containing phosphohydrolase [Halorhodospira halophila]MCC3751075.1 HD domain-containing protein [Halorhodospira halophila]